MQYVCTSLYYLPTVYSLIAARREQSNFQLVVITHDPEFVEMMGRSDHVDDFLKLEREGYGIVEDIFHFIAVF